MILEKYDEDKDNSKRVKISLFEKESQLVLSAVNDKGEPLPNGELLTIMSTGKVLFHYDIDKKIGFPLGENGELLIASEVMRSRKVTYQIVEEIPSDTPCPRRASLKEDIEE